MLLLLMSLLIFNGLFLTIHVKPIVSKSTGLIFAKFSELVELWLWMISLK